MQNGVILLLGCMVLSIIITCMFCHCVGNNYWEASDAAEFAGVELTLRGDVQMH